MIEYRPLIFYDHPREDPEDWLREMQRYIVASRINVAPGAGQVTGREKAFGLIISYNLDVATLTAVRAIGAGNGSNQIGDLNIAGAFHNKARAEIGRIGAGVATDEDWSIVNSELTDNAPVAPNADGGFTTVTIASSIKLRQLLYLFSTSYMTVEYLKQMAVFGQLMQEDMDVKKFSTRIKKENITKALAEVEKFTLSQRNALSSLSAFPAANPYIDTNKSGMTKTEIVDLIKTTMASSESQMAQQNTNLQSTIKSFQETMSRATKTLDNSKKSSKKRAKDTAINYFLSNLLRKNLGKHSANKYDYDSIEDISDSLAGLTLNSVIKTAIRHAIKKSSGYKCSIYPNSDSNTSSDTSSSDSSDSNTSLEDSSDSGESPSNTSLITKVVSLDLDKKEDLDDLIEIDFVKKKEPKTSITTVKYKIKHLKIPVMTVNSETELSIITENIVIHVGAKIDKSETHDFSGIATVSVKSVGIVRKLLITLAQALLKKYNCALDWKTNKLKIPLNEKDYIILVTMHKVKNKLKVNCANITLNCDDFLTLNNIS
ncbi:4705_t:CDS:2 [Cetraspora pellucida]|uniref:4705_t:CDS:1 n=1 Tax=Cetraspora pellucida TaxID=1433469 RepID=A0A9N8ZN81_9GLOM|nr:4705_t:CDS:2 [Cetraspora pellucida]